MGSNDFDNWQALALPCDKAKTYGSDIPRIAKAKRLAAKAAGKKKPKRPIKGQGFRPRMKPCNWPSRKLRSRPFEKRAKVAGSRHSMMERSTEEHKSELQSLMRTAYAVF